jgi:putative transposase
VVNHKKIARLCKAHNLLIRSKKKKKSKFNKIAQNHLVTKENQVWEFDIKYGYLHSEKAFFFLLAFIDVCTRKIKGWYVGKNCKAQDLLDTLSIALEGHQITSEDGLCIRSDNGPQMRAKVFIDGLKNLPAENEYIPVMTPNKNAHIESFFSIVDVHLQEQYFWELKDAYAWTMRFVDFYNNKRIHGSLKMSPVDYSKLTHLHGQEQYAQAI